MSTEELTLKKGRMVVAVDGSPSSIEALEWASKHAQKLDCYIEVIAMWQVFILSGDPIAAGMPFGLIVPDTTLEHSMHAVLNECAEKVFEHSRPLDLIMRTVQGDPTYVLIEESKTATMLVLGSRGHGKLHNLVLGSVSASCAAKAHCPVLIVRGQD